MRQKGISEVSKLKDEIQHLVREIVIKRDGGCILRDIRHCTDEVLQADHLITRANSATYDDTRLIVCLCRSCHGWKHWHEREYNALVKTILPKKIVELWERAEQDSWKPTHRISSDWKLSIAGLKQELKELQI
jgi:hypothetical protein